MPQPQLSVRSAKARAIARRLAHKERRSIAQVVERALERYEQEDGRESPQQFWRRFAEEVGPDVDLDALLEDHRKPHPGPDL
jgi:hypothetical protein